MLANTFLVLTPGNSDLSADYNDYEVLLPLARRSIIALSNDARYKWLHSIKRSHIRHTRQAITIRELSEEFKGDHDQGRLGKSIEQIACTYKGVSLGLIEYLAISNCISLSKNMVPKIRLEYNVDKLLDSKILDHFSLLQNSFASIEKSHICVRQSNHGTVAFLIDIGSSKFILKIKKILPNDCFDSGLKRVQVAFSKLDEFDVYEVDGFNFCLRNFVEKQMDINRQDVLFNIGREVAKWPAKIAEVFIFLDKKEEFKF